MMKNYFPKVEDFQFEPPEWAPLPAEEDFEEAQEEQDDYEEEEGRT